MKTRIEHLESGLKLIGLLTPEARHDIVQAFLGLEAENAKLHSELSQLRIALSKAEDRIDRMQHYLIEAGKKI